MADGQDTKVYVPGYLPSVAGPTGVPTLLSFLQREFKHIAQALSNIWDMPVLNSPPERLKIGRVAYADGTNWNPGSGEGPYIYTSSGWVPMF